MPPPLAGELVVSSDEFRGWVRSGRIFSHMARHTEGRLVVHRLESAGRPFPLGLALRALARGRVSIEDVTGRRRELTTRDLTRWGVQVATEPFRVAGLLHAVGHEVDQLERETRSRSARSLSLDLPPLYLRTDLAFGVRAGGSVGHIAGVVNELDAFAPSPILLTTDDIPTLKPSIERHLIAPSEHFWNFRELPTFVLNDATEAAERQAIGSRPIGFVYQRYSTNNYAGIRIAARHGVPFVLEYNGSEVWVGRHWSKPLKYEALTDRIELLNATAADLIVVVSQPLADELAGRGVDRRKILVNPNGVDTDRYRPDVDGRNVRERYGLDGKIVIGFIGTFGPWHGAEVLARAFVALRNRQRAFSDSVRLLMIGDGAAMPAVQRILSEGGASGATVFTGLVPQEAGPPHLAACDVLASPHVSNPDGTPFFGSPTKLFEYMAMGRGIVASDLDQIGEVLEHGRTAWLVKPGSENDLADGLQILIEDAALRHRLGAEARRRVVATFTWREHTKRTIARLRELMPVKPANPVNDVEDGRAALRK